MPQLLDALEAWGGSRLEDLGCAWDILHILVTQGQLPEAATVTNNVIYTVLATIASTYLVAAVIVSRQQRKLVLEILDTTVATLLLIVLVVIVLGLPIGAMYLLVKAIFYFGHSLVKLEITSTAWDMLKARLA